MNKNQQIIKYLNQIINNDIEKLIEVLHSYCSKDINIDQLRERYMPNIHSDKKKINKKKKFIVQKKLKNSINTIKSKKQCTARCWGGPSSVKYNPHTQKWIYGTRCKRKAINSKYCTIHNRLSLRSSGLPHGHYNHDPPHNHYLKYQQKILNGKHS